MKSLACPKCGRPLTDQEENGICCRCLLALGLAASAEDLTPAAVELEPLLARPVDALGVKFHRFGEYELLEELARGGMGVVFRARQIGLNRTVALKVIRAGRLASAEQVRRFRVEAETAASLDHPHIVPIYEIGEHAGQHYFSMKLIEGGSLARRLSELQTPISEREAAKLVACTARAVHFAHQRAILHRDIKPGNILLDGDGQPHVTDFGLAKVLIQGADLKQTIALLGTPNYMSPEQACGQARELTTASDIYSLGAVLYELLTGQPPFTGDTLIEVLRQVSDEEPLPPSQFSRRRAHDSRCRTPRCAVDRDLETICMKCLEKNPSGRYSSAAGLAADLERWLNREPIMARPIAPWERFTKWMYRNPASATAFAAIMVVGLIGVIGVVTQLRRARAGERDAQQQLYVARVNQIYDAWEEGNLGRARHLLESTAPKPGGEDIPRGFEMRYLSLLCRDESRRTITNSEPGLPSAVLHEDQVLLADANDAGVRAAVFWTNERLLVAGKNTVRPAGLFGEPQAALFSEPEGIQRILLSPAMTNIVAVATLAHRVKLWDLSTGRPLVSSPVQPHPIRAMAFSPDGQWLAWAAGKTVELWRPSSPSTRPRTIARYSEGAEAMSVVFSPDGERLITCGSDHEIRVFHTASGSEQGAPLKAHTAYVLTLAVSPDGKLLASGANDGRIILWDLNSRLRLFGLPDQRAAILHLAFSPDGRRLVSGGRDQTVRLWDVQERSQEAILRGHEGAVRTVAFSPTGEFLLSIGRKEMEENAPADGTRKYRRTWMAKVWDAAAPRQQNILDTNNSYIMSVEFSSDGCWLASADSLGTAKLWDPAARRLETKLKGHNSLIRLRFAPGGRLLATGDQDGIVRVWRPGNESPLATLTNRFGVIALDFAPDGNTLAAGGGPFITLWDVRSWRTMRTIEFGADDVFSVAYDPRGRYLAAGLSDGSVRLWQASTYQAVASWKAHSRFVPGLAFSPDGTRLASGGGDAMIALYDPASPGTFELLRGHTHAIWSLAFAPDGLTLASAGLDSTPKLWSLATREVALSLKSSDGLITCVAFCPSGNCLATGGADGVVRLWPAEPSRQSTLR